MHKPVLLNKIIEFLNPKPGNKFIDATIDGGGHALALLERIMPSGRLLGIEWDSVLYKNLKARMANSEYAANIILVNDNYTKLADIAEKHDFKNVNGILFDLGMSSWHLEEAGRGFSFQRDEPLDMRFQATGENSVAAEDIIKKYSEGELIKIFKEYGEERFAKAIAGAIVKERKLKPITGTFQLVEIIKGAVPFWYRRRRIHFATKVFQALRIAVNNELENIKQGLEQAEEILGKGGRLAVISFHSLEDRIVKDFFKEKDKLSRVKKSKYAADNLPIPSGLKILTKKPAIADLAEISQNPRARSAKLRVAEKI